MYIVQWGSRSQDLQEARLYSFISMFFHIPSKTTSLLNSFIPFFHFELSCPMSMTGVAVMHLFFSWMKGSAHMAGGDPLMMGGGGTSGLE